MNEHPKPEKRYWLDDPMNVRTIYRSLIAVCGLLLSADAFYHKHVEVAAEAWFGFYGLFGFVACVGLVLGAKELRKILMRDETYYDD
jgi:hypothetical protein